MDKKVNFKGFKLHVKVSKFWLKVATIGRKFCEYSLNKADEHTIKASNSLVRSVRSNISKEELLACVQRIQKEES